VPIRGEGDTRRRGEQRDPEDIIELSEQIKKSSEALGKVQRKD
jgi:hypothetical protein